jgi:hypothetical protein
MRFKKILHSPTSDARRTPPPPFTPHRERASGKALAFSQAQSAKVVPSEKCVKFAQTQNLIVENKALLTR